MLIKKAVIALAVALTAPAAWSAAPGGDVIQRANTNVSNTASLQRGARNFVNYCSGCHSARYVRYSRLAEDLGLSEAQVIENLMFTGERVHDTIRSAIPEEDAARWFGVPPPDLSLIARSRSSDYVYSFLKSFYLDPSRPTGVNNLVLPGTSMPHVLWSLQGYQAAVYDGQSDAARNAVHKQFKGFELVEPGSLTPAQYDQFVLDTVNFLEYIAEPMALERRSLGMRVLAFLFVFFLLAWLLKKEYWKNVK
ncbi:MAG TPA: cytochrome c1 [Steroidobacter sp.]|jgi:ubiquinol-cytochrome c reductase cytochrome c1 subunit|nr:cytochrome c1 [Steroidobacteraceae bacterium]HLS80314.1 cytochrome c1 [Steroidobacter sp.]